MSTTKVNVWLLVDASGSMDMPRTKSNGAQDLAATLTEAFKRIPTVRLHIYQHNAYTRGEATLYRVFEDGKLNKLASMTDNTAGGNADGFALQWVGNQALRHQRPDERTLIVVISDGLPSVHGQNATNHDLISFSHSVSSELRLRGASVMSVSVEAGQESNARSMYGPENVVEFHVGSPTAWSDLARGLGDLFGKMLKR